MKLMLLGIAAGLLVLVGCGGAAMGQNMIAETSLFSSDINSLELIISPTQGAPGNIAACRDQSDGFGCDRFYYAGQTTYRFRTNSLASAQPYYVYLRNTSTTAANNFSLEILVGNRTWVNFGDRLAANEIRLVAEIHRNSAGERP